MLPRNALSTHIPLAAALHSPRSPVIRTQSHTKRATRLLQMAGVALGRTRLLCVSLQASAATETGMSKLISHTPMSKRHRTCGHIVVQALIVPHNTQQRKLESCPHRIRRSGSSLSLAELSVLRLNVYIHKCSRMCVCMCMNE